ncbi:hypothetical protein B0T22DRAFT_498721 [Podospora appendiculata]|uniref:Peptidase M20 dimerisation domain-containing protein n=1 Tax=Podospora appendiculata TaxID=314037 RepID=A0AAE0XA64_9PEZI|nr:hypothetical protein B0T22DRAFT_498721 [Podospora appendiculata]
MKLLNGVNPCLLLLLAPSPFKFSAATQALPPQHPLQDPLQDPLSISSSTPLLALHESLVNHPSTTGLEANITTFLQTHLESHLNLTVHTQPVAPNRQNLLAYLGTSRTTRLLLTSHIDTVPPYIPYSRHGNALHGRGTVDAKGSVAAQILAFSSLLASGAIHEGDVALLYVVGEETGGAGMGAVNDLGLSWEAVIFGEPTELKLARGHKGGLGFTITAKGRAGHSGYPELGTNAIDVLVRALYALQGLKLPSSKTYGNTTLTVGKISGGVAANVIPESAFATVSVRVAAGTPEGIQELIERAVLAAEPGVELSFSYGIGPIPLDYDIEGFETTVVSYGTDIPRLKGDHKKYLYGPGSILVAHSDHEHLTVADLEAAVEGYKTLILESLKR